MRLGFCLRFATLHCQFGSKILRCSSCCLGTRRDMGKPWAAVRQGTPRQAWIVVIVFVVRVSPNAARALLMRANNWVR